MNENKNPKQQIIDKIKESSNILITVSKDPTVDALSAAIGLTLILTKFNKHATAIVSGEIPPAIEFLKPNKTFENNVDSLRDFIIALNKEKADHLRYKVEGDIVKIFITPYRTKISKDDLQFSQGDYNVELVIALGVKDESHLDRALEAHGRILHDAAVATIEYKAENGSLGNINWLDSTSTSICEMIMSLVEGISGDRSLIDSQVATALLTGIVSETNRFSNNKTSPKIMTTAAQLMAQGADQQLIAMKLSSPTDIQQQPAKINNQENNSLIVEKKDQEIKSEDAKNQAEPQNITGTSEPQGSTGTLLVSHERKGSAEEVTKQVNREKTDAAVEEVDKILADKNINSIPKIQEPKIRDQHDENNIDNKLEPQSLGGTLNATTEQASMDKLKEQVDTKNRTILNHGLLEKESNDLSETVSPINSTVVKDKEEPASIDPFSNSNSNLEQNNKPLTYDNNQKSNELPQSTFGLNNNSAGNITPNQNLSHESNPQPIPDSKPTGHESARAAVDAAFDDHNIDINLNKIDSSNLSNNPAQNNLTENNPQANPEKQVEPSVGQQNIQNNELPPLPDLSLPPKPSPPASPQFGESNLPPNDFQNNANTNTTNSDPSQFQIPK